MIGITAKVYGRVQLVMFRDFVTRNARKLGVSGEVKNLPDGTVFAYMEGEREDIEKMFVRLKKGSLLSRVDRVERGEEVTPRNCQGFQIVYS